MAKQLISPFAAFREEGGSKSDLRGVIKRREQLRRDKARFAAKNHAHAKRSTSDGTVTLESWRAMKAHTGGYCIVSNCLEPGDTQDHVVPVSKGGPHSIHNLQPMCQHHNSSKHDNEIDHRPADWPWL